jgi:hypothetical protein
LKDIFSEFTEHFGLVKEGRWLRFLDSDNLKIITRSDHVIFSTDPQYKPTDMMGRPLPEKTFIIQLGKQSLIDIGKLGFQEGFADKFQLIHDIIEGQSRYVRFENDPHLKNYMSEEMFNKLKDQMESKGKITLPSTKEFFEVESYLTAMDFCLKQLQDI